MNKGLVGPFVCQIIPKGYELFYSSAKFKELQIDRILNGETPEQFPSNRHFFLSNFKVSTTSYSQTIQNLKTYYHHILDIAEKPYMKQNFNVTHVYKTTKNTTLIDLLYPDNLKYLMFVDTTSPFHIDNNDKDIHKIDDLLYRFANEYKDAFEEYQQKYGIINPYGGFGLLLVATNYHMYELGKNRPQRYSDILIDYEFSEIFRKYLYRKAPSINGWYNDPYGIFHEEFMFFKPQGILVNVFEHKLGWYNQWIELDPVPFKKKTQEMLAGLTEYYESREAILKKLIKTIKTETSQERESNIQDYIDDSDTPIPREEAAAIYDSNQRITLANAQEELETLRTEMTGNTIHQLTVYIKKISKVRSFWIPLQKHHNRSKGWCRMDSCNTMGFEKCQNSLKRMADEMGLYKNIGNIHHVGESVADHSIWVTRSLFKWLSYKNHPWTQEIWPELRNITLISAFTHDIGKLGDLDHDTLLTTGEKRDHPHRGFQYFTEQLEFKTTKKMSYPQLTKKIGCYYSNSDKTISAVVAAMHHHFGELLMSNDKFPISKVGSSMKLPYSFNYLDYYADPKDNRITYILDTIYEFKYIVFYHNFLKYLKIVDHDRIFLDNRDNLEQLLLILLAVSAADTYGAHPVDINKKDSIYDAPTSKLLDPQVIFKTTKLNPNAPIISIMRPYYRYLYYTFGLVEKDQIIQFGQSVSDPDVFLDAWNNFTGFITNLKNKNKRLPIVYRLLDQSDPDRFITELLRLLKSGEIPTNKVMNTSISKDIREYLLGDATDKEKLKVYQKHRHPIMANKSLQAPF